MVATRDVSGKAWGGGTPRSAAQPVTFAGTVGLYAAPRGNRAADAAVLFISPWGLEEMCVRKYWRILADDFADAGIASLRFDYPDTGDALDMYHEGKGLALWTAAVTEAAGTLRRLSGCDRIIAVAQGIGVPLLCAASSATCSYAGAALLAPVVSGRGYMRELQAWARLIDEGLGLGDEGKSNVVSIAGLEMPSAVSAGLKAVDLKALATAPCPRCLIVARDDRPSDAALAAHLRSLDVEVEEVPFTGYQDLVSNPVTAKVPQDVTRHLQAWVMSLCAFAPAAESGGASVPDAERLCGDGFREQPVRFGENGRLYGVICEPAGERRGATAILLGTAFDRHAGWARSTVGMARDLAREGIASLRFDAADVADSPPLPGFDGIVLYNDIQQLDVEAAVDFIEVRGLGPVVIGGRCSGAYLAFRSAIGSDHLRGVVAANPYDFYWDRGRNVEQALTTTARSLNDYRAKLLSMETLRRLAEGRIDIANALRNVVKAVGKRLAALAGPLQHLLPGVGKARREVRRAFEKLARNDTRLLLLYSENDIGYDHFAQHFGAGGEGLSRFGNARYMIVPGADHNFTPKPAREAYLKAVSEMALSFPVAR